MWQNTSRLAITLRRGHASQITSHELEHAKVYKYARACVCTHRKSISLSVLSYSTMDMSTPISAGVHHRRLAGWYKTNSYKTL
jgi:hypothetical protein